MFFKTIYQQYH